jgi:hypothetical protein
LQRWRLEKEVAVRADRDGGRVDGVVFWVRHYINEQVRGGRRPAAERQ